MDPVVMMPSLAFAIVTGLSMLVVACFTSASRSWWPMSVVLLYPLSPLPLMRAQRCEQRFSQSPACREFAYFVTTGIIFSTFALPIVLAHAAVISWLSCMLTSVASAVIFLTILAYCRMQQNDNSGVWN